VGYTIAAVVARLDLLTEHAGALPVVPLQDGWGLVPFPGADPDPDPDLDPTTVDTAATVRQLSATGPVAYVEADIFGGRGTQRAAVWQAGAVVFGPVDGWIGEGPTPISRALAALGVRARGQDEFATIGLGRHRHTENWLPDALPR
jgi:hypothetical protein